MRDQSLLIRGGVGFDGFLEDHVPLRGEWRGEGRLKNLTTNKEGSLEYYRASGGRSRKSYCGTAKILLTPLSAININLSLM